MTTTDHTSVDDALELPYRQAAHFGEDAPEEEKVGLLRRFGRDLSSVKELRRTPYGMAPVLIFGFSAFFQRFDSYAVTAATPEIVRELGIGLPKIIELLSLVGAVSLVVSLFIGWYADRHKRVPLYSVGNTLGGLCASLSGFGKRTATFGSARVADDAFENVSGVPSFSLLADYYPPEVRGRVFAFLGTLGKVGSLMSVVLVPFVVGRVRRRHRA